MSGSYTDVFGGTTIYPSSVSYLALALTANTTLEWPLEASTGNDIVARIIDVTPTGAYSITMPPASQTGTGQTILFNNLGPSTITVLDNDGGTLLSLAQGEVWQIYLRDNSTDAGLWRVFQYGASTAQAQASALAGYGLVAQGSLLSTNAPTTEFNANYTLGVADRASNFVWTGASGTLTLLAVATATNGYYVLVRNGGSGQLTLDPTGSETINGTATLVLQPGDSVIVVCSGAAWYTIGYGQDAVFAFDYTAISLTGEVNEYVLAGAELNRIAYSFTGVLTTNMDIVVPATTQQYWVANNTTGSFTLSVKTDAQVTGVTVAQGARAILYCDGTNVVDATTGGLATPLAVADGGTGSTTAGGALINLGGTATGIGVFTAANAAAARTAIGITATPVTAAFFVYRSANVTNFSGNNSFQQYPLNTESSDLGGCYNTASYQFTAPAAGTLEGGFQTNEDDTSGSNWQWQRILLRGSVFGDVYIEGGLTPTAGFTTASFSRPYKVKVASGETVQMWCRNQSTLATKTSTLNSGLNTGVMWWGSFVPD